MQLRSLLRKINSSHGRFFSGVAKPVIDMTNKLLPLSTGNGPFVELPTVRPIGEPGTLLKIQLPQSSILNIRTTSVSAVNGNIMDVSSEPQLLTEDLQFHKVSLTSPMSLLVSGTASGSNNYSLIDVKKGDKWELADVDNLVAWSGYDLSVTPKKTGVRTSLLCEGKGFLVVNGYHNVLDVTVEENELILLSPSALIASNVHLDTTSKLGTTQYEFWKLNVRKVTVPHAVLSAFASMYRRLSDVYSRAKVSLRASLGLLRDIEGKFLYVLEKVKDAQKWLSLTIKCHVFNRAPLFYVVKGPARVLMVDKSQLPNTMNFTKTQIVEQSRS